MFFFDTPSWTAYALENLLILKLLHDRGFDVGGVGSLADGFVGRFFDIMFGLDNITWNEKIIHFDLDSMDEDTEEYFMLQMFVERDHYEVEIKINDLNTIGPAAEKILMETLQKVVPDECDYTDGVFPWYEYFVDISWLKENDQIVGTRFHFADTTEGCCDDEAPASACNHLKIFIEFWDQLQSLGKEVLKSA